MAHAKRDSFSVSIGGMATIRRYALQHITAIMCSSRLSAASLSRLPAVGFHQPFPCLI
jgi:hypothetical protein